MHGRRFRASGITVEAITVPPGVHLRGHGHPGAHVCCVIGGAFDEAEARGRRRCGAGSSRISPAGDRHDIRFGPEGARCLLVLLDDAADASARGWRERRFLESAPVLSTATRLYTALTPGSPADALSLECASWELLAELQRGVAFSSGQPVPPWLARIRERLRADPRPLTMADLAVEEGISREHLARAFRAHFGLSPGDYVRRVRLDRARRLLLDGDETIASVAAACGFADQSHLTRACRRAFGVPPAALRRRGDRNVTDVQDFPT